ncbi:nascent polypeptide-associated complex subunit alpha, muscle-specific form isoform X3 [Dermacentor silvarum]|uniref:nascent polypeptide-associated complex subunit alpha, muscle-specific form isoform X3 n=1 Tax=Dermacentor silvarum TaxID=543639 RepID=UPI00210184CB|nr:nascent polypeptide-associated complex subunit alpha, muscle-specific form isoform X3 [Dermacentor silvarum]
MPKTRTLWTASTKDRGQSTSHQNDADFDSYWENESRNNNRNRIRVGRQYQATVPPLLRPGESDGRRLEDLETLRWRPESLSEQSIEEYLSMAKAVSLFARAMNKWGPEGGGGPECLQTALRGLSDFVASHHGCQQDAGCRVAQPPPPTWTPAEAGLFARALDECGKNFGAIKKDFLPWKPVKSLIEFYYQGRHPKQEPQEDGEEEEGAAGCSGGHCSTANCVKKEPEVKPEPPDEPEPEDEEELPAAEEAPSASPMDQGGSEETHTPPSGPEVKPMRAKPLKAPEDAASVAPVGSLKFFLGGRLVLKLSAQEGGSWVEAQDTPRLGRPRQPPSEDASDDDDGAPGTSSGAGGGATPPLRGSSRCTSWPETAPLTPSGSLATARMATPDDSTSGGCNNTNNSTEDEDGGDDDSNQQRPPSATRAAPSPKCLPQAPPLGPPPPLNLTLRPPAPARSQSASNSPPPLLMPQGSPLADGCVERCRPNWRGGRPAGVPFLAPLFTTSTTSPLVTSAATGTTADGPLDLSSPVDTKKLVPK